MPITVLNPTSLTEPRPLLPARRLDSVRGTLIGVLDNGKVNTDQIFRLVADRLRERYGVREVVWRRKHNFSTPAPPDLLAELRACDAIITGIGD
jgi:hypothetical protein